MLEDVQTKGVTKEDRIHGGILVLNELLRCSNATWERRYTSLMESTDIKQPQSLEDQITVVPRLKSSFSKWPPQFHNINMDSTHTIIYESAVCRQLIIEKYDNVCHDIMAQRTSRSAHIQQALLLILPRLAAFNRVRFLNNHLSSTLQYLLLTVRGREKDKTAAFITIGLIAVAMNNDIKPFVPKIMEVIKLALPSKETPKKRSNLDSSVFLCITFLGHAVKDYIAKDIKDILEPMLSTGLTPSLTICLRDLAMNIPELKRDISEGLLRMLSQILMHKPLRHPGMPRHLSTNVIIITNLSDSQDVSSIVLALRTLGTFNFDGQSLLQFVRRCADYFLVNEQQEIRLEAVRTCSRLLRLAIQGTTMTSQSVTVTSTVADVLGKLLIVGMTDTNSDVRFSVLASLDDIFDMHLAQAESLSALFVALNDEVFEIRELSMCIIGRLSTLNPAYVMPSLRKTLVQLLTELEHSGTGRNKEQGARMLDHLVVNAPRLIRPYMEPILKVLVPKLRESKPNPGVVLSVLRAIGDLAEVAGGGFEIQQWMPELLTILLEMLVDASAPEKRGVALWTLGQLVGATGHVVKPYNQYPNLLDVLINFLKTEQQPVVRRETIRVLGLLGALDPFKHKINRGQIDAQLQSTTLISMAEKSDETSSDVTTSEMLVNMSSSTLEEYYPAIAIATLIRIIRDPTLAQHHTMVVQAVTFIFKSLGIKCVPYISQVLPNFLIVVRTTDVNFREFLFQQLALLIAIVKQHIRNYLDDIFILIKEFWTNNSPLQATLILLVECIAVALGAEFKIYLPQLMPNILRVLNHDTSKDRIVTIKLLQALQKFGNNLDDYMHLVIPPIVKLFDAQDCPIKVRKIALETIDQLADILDFSDFISRIIHPLVRTLDTCPELRSAAMETLCSLVSQLGKKYNIFVSLVQKIINKHKIICSKYDILVSKITTETTLADDTDSTLSRHKSARNKNREINMTSSDTTMIKRLNVTAANLQNAWTATRRVSKDDWLEWLRRLSIELLKESPSPALRSCLALAQTYSQLPKDLFNAAFVSCWTELSLAMQSELINSLEQALMVPDLPEITQTILNLAEFMEHCDKGPLPLDPQVLGERAMYCRAYAKALHYKEEEFQRGASSQVVEALISINNKLQQKEAAEGLLEYVMNRNGDIQVQVRWYEKLHNWEKALALYHERLDALNQESLDEEACLGQMRCLEALGEWDALYTATEQKWSLLSEDNQQKAGRLAAASAWGLNQWDAMERYVNCIPQDTQDGAFYRGVLAIHKEHFDKAQLFIESARDLLDTELTAMAGESYQRAYGAMVYVQMLSELEEVIQYKLVPERRSTIRAMWWHRLQAGQRIVEDWQRIIQVHTLVLTPQEDMHTWLKYASLCRKSGSVMLSHKTLVMLLGTNPSLLPDQPLPYEHPQVTFAYTKHLWMSGQRLLAFKQLHNFVQNFTVQPSNDEVTVEERRRLLARCYLKLGGWQESLQGITEESIPMVLQCYAMATDHDPTWYKAWHSWAYMNFETVLFYKHQNENNIPNRMLQNGDKSNSYIGQFTVPAVEGFFKSIKLSQGSSLQDTLRLLTLWFDYGQWPEVYDAVVEGIRLIEINTWLQVIPQLIARIDTPRALVSRLIHHLLIDIGKSHPQALVYPLTVASKSASALRRTAANKILKSMCEHSSTLVAQAVMISDELIRVAILWHELWHEGLEEASRLYFGEHNVKGMLDTLEPLHAMLERGPQTLKETSFNQAYGRDLMDAQEWCQRYKVLISILYCSEVFIRPENCKHSRGKWGTLSHFFTNSSVAMGVYIIPN